MSQRVAELVWADELIFPHTLPRSFYVYPEVREATVDGSYSSNAVFWEDVLDERISAEVTVTLLGFNLFEWIPRNPGLFHTPDATYARNAASRFIREIEYEKRQRYVASADALPDHAEFRRLTAAVGTARTLIYTPDGKISMLQGGVGCIRLQPVELKNGGVHWFMAATSTRAPDEGIPLLIPNALYQKFIDNIRSRGNLPCDIVGITKFIPKELSDLYSSVRGIQRLYVEVLEIRETNKRPVSGEVSVAASFISEYEGFPKLYAAYVTFNPGLKGARRNAAHWMQEEYVEGLYEGSVLTDFDQQAPELLGDCLFSLRQVSISPNLAKEIAILRSRIGYFNWSMLESATIIYGQENIMVKNVGGVHIGNVGGDFAPSGDIVGGDKK